ncbi:MULTISPECIES: VOC family protein [unclassified Beijerinckia]|uniref:VOC family protein n=1 Tax=unclassified Beijerinckia TaxID=2638183 RepID=UPI00089A613B|nr:MULTISPECIES: VOC family protein [unclassified Beijerinckia]MDH7794250.1 catechol 2,3-dioxygenase-like lactoylglutathione lyase family enzyme [Beijerinckia sp. GAS462]SEB56846.1 catechol 2,3-dioxygenase [Beijerinckia sp. 28-YEA-48]
MIQVKRLGHATFSTPDLEQQIDYWTQVVGLSLVERGKDHAFLATRLGQESIALERGQDKGHLQRLAFQVKPGSDLGELAANLQKHGVKSEMRKDISPGVSNAIAFYDPKGTLIEVYADYNFAPSDNLDNGIQPQKFGHVAYRVKDVQKLSAFYCDVLGFRASDWLGDHFSFLRCGVDHHTINFVRYEEEALHHIAFELRDWGSIRDACDFLDKKKIPLVWGPLRHIVGHNIAAYHRNPDHIRVELFTELDMMLDEDLGYWEPRPWHQERPLRPKVWDKSTLRSQWGFGSHGNFEGYP